MRRKTRRVLISNTLDIKAVLVLKGLDVLVPLLTPGEVKTLFLRLFHSQRVCQAFEDI